MNWIPLAVSLVNLLANLAAKIPDFVAQIRASGGLTDEGAALLDKLDDKIAEHERKLDEIKDLPVPEPKSEPAAT